ncbi:hypothetical protein FO519_007049 [Halicephalobus sp. NKZ332]|nr:hypothetical protein FO519_007049 [Halicephalobus sp. NKZ332]
MKRQFFLQLLFFYIIIQSTEALPTTFRHTILKIQGLDSNDLIGRQSRSSKLVPLVNPEVRASANNILMNLFQRIASPNNFGLIRPAEPLSTNENSLKWEKLGWGW